MLTRRHLLKISAGAMLFPQSVQAEAFTSRRPLMGTLFVIKSFDESEKKFHKTSDEAFAVAEKINSVASDYIADSELLSFSKLPHGKPYPVSDTLFPLLLEAKELARQTKGNSRADAGENARARQEATGG